MYNFFVTFVVVIAINLLIPTKAYSSHFTHDIEHHILDEIYYYKDNTSSKSISDILKINKWQKSTNISFGYSKDPFWIKLDFKTLEDKNKHFLVFHDYLIDKVNIYYVKDNSVKKEFTWGLKSDSDKNAIHFRKASFPLDNELDSIYLKVHSQNYPITSNVELYDEMNFYKMMGFDTALTNIFFVIIFLMLFYHAFLYFITKVKIYIYYSVYLILLIITASFSTNFIHLYLLKEPLSNFQISIFQFIGLLMIFSLIYIMKPFLKIKVLCEKILNINMLLLFSLFITGRIYLLITNNISETLSLLLNFSFILLIATVIFILIKTYKNSLFSSISMIIWFPLFSMFLLFASNQFFVFIDPLLIEYLLKFVFIYETIIISLIIAYKVKNLEEKKVQLELKAKENEIFMLRTTKLAAMGEMINNIAHQWKQPLARVNSILFDMNYSIEKCTKQDFQKAIDLIENEVIEMSKTISSFSQYFHPKKSITFFKISEVIEEQIKYFTSDFNKNQIELSLNYENDISTEGYKEEYSQVVSVILQNAIDSLKTNKVNNPKITIYIQSKEDSPLLEIENNGEKIKQEDINRVFEPYFTTKNDKHNNGIGLYMSKMLIEDGMKKRLLVENTKNGVKFSILG